MTSELEQKFYDTFGIKPEFGYWCKRFDETGIANCNGILDAKNKCAKCENGYIKCKYYPEITDRKLLEMICIINKSKLNMLIDGVTIQEIKEKLLHKFINLSVSFEKEIKQLFKD